MLTTISTFIYYGLQEETPDGAVQAPFFMSQFQPPRAIKAAAFAILGSSAVLLSSNPFQGAQAATPRQISRPAPDQIHSSLALLSNPVFNPDFSVSRFPKTLAATLPVPNIPLLFGTPITPIDWSRPRTIIASKIPVLIGFQIQYQTPPDTHDVYVKRKSKRRHDWIEDELAAKARRRAAIELAVYGPEVTYEPAPVPFDLPSAPAPDVTGLAQAIMAAQTQQKQAIAALRDQDEETDLEAILREIL